MFVAMLSVVSCLDYGVFLGLGIVCWWVLLIDLVSWLLVRCCGFGCCDYGCAGL